MDTSSNKKNKFSEADVDSLLTNFFLDEVPVEFREEPTTAVASSSANSTRTAWAVMATTAAALMFAVIVFQSTGSTPQGGHDGHSMANTSLIPADTVTPVTDRIQTEEGTVEMKTWLTKEQDTESGTDLTGIHFELEFDLEPDTVDPDEEEANDDSSSRLKDHEDSTIAPDVE